MSPHHLLEIDDLRPAELHRVLELAQAVPPSPVLLGRSVGLYFEKPSLRTRHSCEAAISRLGGHPVSFVAEEAGIGTREPAADVARVLSGYHSVLGARVADHQLLEDLAAAATVPLVNLLSDRGHPCQALADLLTIVQEWERPQGRTLCWVGDFNNVARSLCLGAAMCSMQVRIASPSGYGPSESDLERLVAAGLPGLPVVTCDVREAAEGAHVVSTDVWTSMGQENERDLRLRAFAGFGVDAGVMAAASTEAIFLHCLPVHRGEEVTAEVADGPASRMVTQAHNRMLAMIGLFRWFDEIGDLS